MKAKVFSVLCAAALILSGCSVSIDIGRENPPSAEPLLSKADILIYYSTEHLDLEDSLDKASGRTYTLLCNNSGLSEGTHPNPELACATLLESYNQYNSLISQNIDTCTMIYGGPQKARITGTINEKIIDISLSRENGCAINEWETWSSILNPISALTEEPFSEGL